MIEEYDKELKKVAYDLSELSKVDLTGLSADAIVDHKRWTII